MEETYGYIVIIDDNFTEDEPLVVSMKMAFSNYTIILKNNEKDGWEFIHNNLGRKMIVLLDYDLGNSKTGTQILKNIRKETSLIYVIIITAKNYESIPPKDLVEFINENALAIVDKTFSLKKKIEIIKKATIELDVRVDCIIEQWIQNLDPLERNTPYIRTKDGVDYTLESMLHEIRNRTEHGLILERNTILLAIDLLIRNKKEL